MNKILGFISLCSAKIVAGKCHLTPMNQAGAIKQRKTFPTGQRVFTKRDSQLQRLLENSYFPLNSVQNFYKITTEQAHNCLKLVLKFGLEKLSDEYRAHMIQQLIPKL